MKPRPAVLFALLALSLTASADPPPPTPAPPTGPVTRVWIKKGTHTMKLFAGDVEVKSYKVALGPGGAGPKSREGDSVTPTGHFHITMHQPSTYKIFLRLDYPTAADWTHFNELKKKGSLPEGATIGGDIGIHGAPPNPIYKSVHKTWDWTLGCIAVNDDEIVEISGLVKDGTAVDIED